MHRILVATHGRPTAEGALRLARALAARHGATVEIVTVLAPLPAYDPLFAPAILRRPELTRECEDDLMERVRAQVARLHGAPAGEQITLVHGQPAREIARVA